MITRPLEITPNSVKVHKRLKKILFATLFPGSLACLQFVHSLNVRYNYSVNYKRLKVFQDFSWKITLLADSDSVVLIVRCDLVF